MIGPKGSRLRKVGTEARKQIEALLGTPSTSTCTSRSPRTGSATRGSCASWASDQSASSTPVLSSLSSHSFSASSSSWA